MSRVDASTSLSASYSSYSGVDIRVVINGEECGSIQHLSYMIQREKAPNYIMGSVDAVSFSRGKRGINGVIRGLLLDNDLLYSRSFENEKALLDKDEAFFLNEKSNPKSKIQQSPVMQKLKPVPDPLPSKSVWVWRNFIRAKVLPGQSLPETVEDCLEGAFEGALKGAAVAAVGLAGGPAALIGVAQALILAIEGCLAGIISGWVYKGGALQLASDIFIGMSSSAYDDALYINQRLIEETIEYNKSMYVAPKNASSMIEKKSGTYSFEETKEYDLNNLGNNYSVNQVEYLDQILPFDITIIAVNEYGQSAQMRIYGCEITSANSEMSIDSMTLPYSLNFTARSILPWRSFKLAGENNKGATTGNQIKQTGVTSSNPPSQPSSFGTGVKVSTLNQGSLLEDEELDAADNLIDDDLDAGNDGIEEPLDSDGDGAPDEDDAAPFDPNIQ